MPVPELTKTQRSLVDALTKAGPARWALDVSPEAAPFIRVVMSAYLQENCNYLGMPGLVVSPAATMHNWWAAGWQGQHITSVGFLQTLPVNLRAVYGVVLFDEQQMYSAKFLQRLDEFFAVHAERCLFRLPAKPDEGLKKVLVKNRFITIKVN